MELGRRALAVVAALAVTLVVQSAWAAPVVVTVTPNEIIKGSSDTTVVVQGTGFVPGSKVWWNGVEVVTTLYGDTQAVGVIPASATTGVGVVSVYDGWVESNRIVLPIVQSVSDQLQPVLYVVAGLVGAMAFIWGVGTRL